MEPVHLILIIVGYFALLLGISKWVERGSNESSFFTGDKSSPWYLVAFGMIGASLSGVTFVSIPGAVANDAFAYFQMVMGYTVGYGVIALVLLPLYYRLQLTSIYSYLDQRYGRNAQLVGSFFFLLSRVIGASLRMYLVVIALQAFVFDQLGIHYSVTIAVSLALIWVYTSKAGIKTIVYTDTLQTLFMLVAMVATLIYVLNHFDYRIDFLYHSMAEEGLTTTFFTDDLTASNTFWKQFLGGAVIAIAMTGLDQDMMQKNLTCSNLKDAQKNVYSFTVVLVFVNALFLILGALLVFYGIHEHIPIPMVEGSQRTDLIFANLAMNHFHPLIGVVFLIGLTAAAYSSADSALTSLTTSFCYDVMRWDDQDKVKNKTKVHLGFTVLLYLVIMIFVVWNDGAAVGTLFKAAGYTYGPLLGLFFFGIITKRAVNDQLIPVVCLLSPAICYGLNVLVPRFLGYSFGYELLLLNGLLTYGLLYVLKPKQNTTY